ncbi:polysaccharide pyruvyl transferase family protein [Maribacter polysiphoniae]|uniref:polysaccharide pyruvyl transferase family protein n=1 Tax=Maribacter polysiphoniae TaxID=429344 RepID=UPI0023528E48|nr:polysaccharide pyruvyl transferase family protein [Maribacter polysiphoniae]
MTDKNKALFIVATQYDNLGDLIINKCLIDELAIHTKVFLDLKNGNEKFTQPLLDGKNVNNLHEEYGFSFRNTSCLKYFISYKKEFNYLFKSPGPLIYKTNPSFKEKLRNKVLDLIYGFFSRHGDMSIIGSEVSLESNKLENSLNELQKVKNLLLRSKDNVKYLRSLNLNNAAYIPDLCFLLRNKVNPNIEKDVIGISFRDLNDPKEDRLINSTTSTLVDFYTKRGKKVVFFYQVERDRDYTFNLYKDFADYPNVSFKEECLEFDEINIYENFRVVISNRLHVILLGFIHNTITFPILNDNFKTRKIPEILESIGYSQDSYDQLTESTLEDTEVNYHKIVKKVNSINEVQLSLCKNKIAEIFGSK